MGVFAGIKGLLSGRRERARTARARRQEALGHLDEATALYVEAGARDEAARVLALRAGSALEPGERLALLAQAAGMAEGDAAHELYVRRARLSLELARAGTLRPGQSELRALGQQLEAMAEPALAADVYALAGDTDAEAQALVAAGAVERLEEVLDARQSADRKTRERDELARRVRDLEQAGRRREALSLGAGLRDDADIAALLRRIEIERVSGPCAKLVLDGTELEIAFGDELVIGRAEATLVVASPAISRRHLLVRRGISGPEALDAGSSNGTTLAGARVDVPVAVGEGIELLLGGEVSVALAPWKSGVRVAVGRRVVYAPLGPLDVDGWRIAPAPDDWLELEARSPAFLGALRVDARLELCRGDALAPAAGAPPRLEVRR